MNNYQPLFPYLLLVLVALGVVLLDTVPGLRRTPWLGWLTAVGALGTLLLSSLAHDAAPWQGLIRLDAYSRAFNTVFLISLALIAIGSVAEERKTPFAGEYYGLLVLSTLGLMLMGAAGGLLALFLGLELSTLCLFALAGIAKREKRSAEAALKLLVLGAVASAVLLYGASILYGVLGSTQYDAMAKALTNLHAEASPALWLGLAFVLGGMAFKISAVPFHLWAPDVYEGAPAMVTAFLSTASKAGGFAALVRFLFLGMSPQSHTVQMLVVGLAVLSMVVGNLVALSQTNLKRLLAYSGIAQSGYILAAVAGGPDSARSVGAILMYLLLYAFTNIGAFLIAQAVSDATGSDEIAALRGLHRRCPTLGFAALVVLFSLGGIPPLAGFVGKLYLFTAAWEGGQQALVLLGALTSVIALYYYLMVARQIYIADPADDRRMPVARPLGLAISLCVLGILVIGVYPRPWVALGDTAASSLRSTAVSPSAGRFTASKPRHQWHGLIHL